MSPSAAHGGVCIGAPTDVGAADRGASMGPEALRVAGLAAALQRARPQVLDLGNLSGPGNPWEPPQEGYRHLPQVTRWNELVHEAVYGELRAARLPILLGGDHSPRASVRSAPWRAIAARRASELRVLWLDAHADFNTSELSPSGNVHGMPVACAVRLRPARAHHLGGVPRPSSPRGCARSASAAWMRARSASCTSRGSTSSTCATWTRWACAQTMEQALAGLDRDTHLHVSFDVDFLDPDIAPGRRHAGAGRADLSRGAAVHGDDRRHAPPRLARRRRTQPGVRCAQPTAGAGGRPHRVAVRQEHAGAPAGVAAPRQPYPPSAAQLALHCPSPRLGTPGYDRAHVQRKLGVQCP